MAALEGRGTESRWFACGPLSVSHGRRARGPLLALPSHPAPSPFGPTLTFPIPGRRSGEPGKADVLSAQRNEVPRRDRLRAAPACSSLRWNATPDDVRRPDVLVAQAGRAARPRSRRSIHSIAHSFTSRRRPSLRVFAQSKLSVPTMRRSGVPWLGRRPTLLVHIEN
jgi:hypothetical protein